MAFGVLDWSKALANEDSEDSVCVLSGLKLLQEDCSFTDVFFTCEDGLVVEAHLAVIERHSRIVREHGEAEHSGCCACRDFDRHCGKR